MIRIGLILILATAVRSQASNFTNGIRNCRSNHAEQLNECLLREIKNVQPLLGNGLPELGIPRLEPLLLENVVFRQSEPPVNVEAVYRNVMVSGITNFDMKYLDVEYNQNKRKLALGMTIPSLTMRGDYKISGNIFLLPIEGEGPFITVLDGVIAEGAGDIVPDGDRVRMTNINIGFKIRGMKTKMDNLFRGNKLLSDTLHHFMNENGQLILDEVRPEISKQLNAFIGQLFNTMFSVLPLDTLGHIPNANKQSGIKRIQ